MRLKSSHWCMSESACKKLKGEKWGKQDDYRYFWYRLIASTDHFAYICVHLYACMLNKKGIPCLWNISFMVWVSLIGLQNVTRKTIWNRHFMADSISLSLPAIQHLSFWMVVLADLHTHLRFWIFHVRASANHSVPHRDNWSWQPPGRDSSLSISSVCKLDPC